MKPQLTSNVLFVLLQMVACSLDMAAVGNLPGRITELVPNLRSNQASSEKRDAGYHPEGKAHRVAPPRLLLCICTTSFNLR